ncbi:MAG: Tm-1-like ATP-binding domain-containing protein, partial [Deltaproteobacteria bacterium]|nr:Tm-1-like ATP-binding domain-containing protein [Deltaproteobacteria bacterium]
LNHLTRKILRNGALALAGMLQSVQITDDQRSKPLIFLSTLGTTEACAQSVRQTLEDKGNEVVIFHTVGSGGKAMEEMLEPEGVSILVDLSLHEMADHRFGGDYDAGPQRGNTALQLGLPTIVVPGNIDFLVSGPLETTRRLFPHRPYHAHNSAITVVRSTHQEIEILAQTLAGWCNEATGPVRMLIPMDGFSAFDSKQGPLYDPNGPQRFTQTMQKNLNDHRIMSLIPCHINDPEFSEAVLEAVYHLNIS